MIEERVYSKSELNAMVLDFEKALQKWEQDKRIRISDWKSYNHEGGVRIEGFQELQWVYFPQYAPGQYDWALWKVERRLENYKNQKGLVE